MKHILVASEGIVTELQTQQLSWFSSMSKRRRSTLLVFEIIVLEDSSSVKILLCGQRGYHCTLVRLLRTSPLQIALRWKSLHAGQELGLMIAIASYRRVRPLFVGPMVWTVGPAQPSPAHFGLRLENSWTGLEGHERGWILTSKIERAVWVGSLMIRQERAGALCFTDVIDVPARHWLQTSPTAATTRPIHIQFMCCPH